VSRCPVQVPDLIDLFVRPLDAVGIPYTVTGGVASVVYGEPRFTRATRTYPET
jgi:hypothetical protein